jgi:hypothetical protein
MESESELWLIVTEIVVMMKSLIKEKLAIVCNKNFLRVSLCQKLNKESIDKKKKKKMLLIMTCVFFSQIYKYLNINKTVGYIFI